MNKLFLILFLLLSTPLFSVSISPKLVKMNKKGMFVTVKNDKKIPVAFGFSTASKCGCLVIHQTTLPSTGVVKPGKKFTIQLAVNTNLARAESDSGELVIYEGTNKAVTVPVQW